MKLTSLTFALLLALTAILPDTTPRRPRTVRLSRSAKQPSFQRFLVDDNVKHEAAETLKGSKRAAFIPILASGGADTADALAINMNLSNDLHYVKGLLPTDIASSSETSGPQGTEQIQAIAAQLQAELLITGTLSQKNQTYYLELVAYEVTGNTPRAKAKGKAEGPTSDLPSISDRALLSLLDGLRMAPTAEARREIAIVATANPTAWRECAKGFQLLFRAMTSSGSADTTNTEQLSIEALEHAERALAADPEFAIAYLMKASAQDNLDKPEDVKMTLRAAKAKLNRADRLTQMELLGDFERFVNGKNGQEKAIKYYEEMLKIDPGHLRALLSLVECLAAEEGRPIEDDLEDAAVYAARLMAAHPGSPVRKLFEEP